MRELCEMLENNHQKLCSLVLVFFVIMTFTKTDEDLFKRLKRKRTECEVWEFNKRSVLHKIREILYVEDLLPGSFSDALCRHFRTNYSSRNIYTLVRFLSFFVVFKNFQNKKKRQTRNEWKTIYNLNEVVSNNFNSENSMGKKGLKVQWSKFFGKNK